MNLQRAHKSELIRTNALVASYVCLFRVDLQGKVEKACEEGERGCKDSEMENGGIFREL